MKTEYALVSENRRQPEPGLLGTCPLCDSAMVSKCGEVRIWHWAHHGKRRCDPWWENQTDWHRDWKNQFPPEWQEIVHQAENGEKHIADVKTAHGWIIEFQHSYLKPAERRSREAFYLSMVWVADGLRRKRDKPSFNKAMQKSVVLRKMPLTILLPPGECPILREWSGSPTLVFLDFGETNLWCLDPIRRDGWLQLTSIQKAGFIKFFCTGSTEKCTAAKSPKSARIPKSPHTGFDQLVARKRRARSRRWF